MKRYIEYRGNELKSVSNFSNLLYFFPGVDARERVEKARAHLNAVMQGMTTDEQGKAVTVEAQINRTLIRFGFIDFFMTTDYLTVLPFVLFTGSPSPLSSV